MVLTQSLGLGYLTAHLLVRRTTNATISSVATTTNQKANYFLTASQTRNSDSVVNAKERLKLLQQQKRNFSISKKIIARSNNNINPFDSNELKQRIGGYSIRKVSSSTTNKEIVENKKSAEDEEQKELTEILKDETWTPIYRFPGIVFCSFISKAKFIQTIGSFLVIPWATYMYASNYQTFDFLLTVYGAAILAPLALYGFSRTFNRMIGVISMNETNEYIRIGYLSLYGTRRTSYIPVDDVIPMTELVSKMERYPKVLQLKRFSRESEWYYLPARGISILDNDKAKLVFGSLAGFCELPEKFKEKVE